MSGRKFNFRPRLWFTCSNKTRLRNQKRIWARSVLLFALWWVGWENETITANLDPKRTPTNNWTWNNVLFVKIWIYTQVCIHIALSSSLVGRPCVCKDNRMWNSWDWNQTSVHNLTFVLAITKPQSIKDYKRNSRKAPYNYSASIRTYNFGICLCEKPKPTFPWFLDLGDP